MEDRIPEVYGALVRGAEAGNINHIRMVLELTGEIGQEAEGKTEIAIVFNDKSIEANRHSVEPDLESDESTINILPIQYGGMRTPVGENGNRNGAGKFSSNGTS